MREWNLALGNSDFYSDGFPNSFKPEINKRYGSFSEVTCFANECSKHHQSEQQSYLKPSCTKVLLYKLQLWHAIRTIYGRQKNW